MSVQVSSFFAPIALKRRWLVLPASVALHVLLIQAISDTLPAWEPREEAPSAEISHITLLPEPLVQQRQPVPKPAVAPVRRTLPAAPAPAPGMPESQQLDDILTETDTAAILPPTQPADMAEIPAATEQMPAIQHAESPAPQYKASPPPPAVLRYDVQALREGQNLYGSGKISWSSDGQNYMVSGEASVLFFTLLHFSSEGMLDQHGVSPVIYTQKRFRRSVTNTHFHRERNTISFSASTLSYPRHGGEQDRASLIWQLAAIGRADSAQLVAGTTMEMFVAGVRDGENWRIEVLGMEPVDTDHGTTNAWHLVRHPRPGSYDQQLDIWLAPALEWYPVRLRYTERNGDYLDMRLDGIEPPQAK